VSVGPLRGKFGSGGTNAAASLAVNPYELKLVPNDRVIEAALEKPLSPWAWQELERRSITAGDAETIMDGLTAWLRREHRGGMLDPLSWLAKFLRELDARGLVTEPQKISFLEAFHGELRCEPAFRLREGARGLTPKLEWGSNWTHDLFGMTLLNELQSVTIDGEPLPAAKFTAYWNSPTYHQSLPLPPLPAGKHVLHLSVLTALVLTADLVGLISSNVPSTDWPAARKRWNRTIDIELDVFPADAEIISAARNPALDPATHGLSIEPVIIRGTGSRKNATLQFKLDGSLAVPIGFDVSLHIAGQTIPCGSLWRAKNANGGTVLSAEIPQLGADVREADVVLTPNPRLIELRSDVDRFWGGEVSFRNVSLRRLDGAGQ